MKKFSSIICSLLMALMLMPAVAQMPQIPAMGVDPEVRIGKLPNGLTYYIRHNEYPKGQADFYIAQKVGSILEEDNQRGLAHFLEHMCFNGTTNFPGKNLINWLESVGVKFGQNLNAYTSVDQTVYNISNVPVARVGVQDSCLLILHDWANDLLLLPEEIDAERGVIHEEWRRSMVGQMRILEKLLPEIYPNSKYGHRLPIGTMEVVDNFSPQALRDYYETWYRPDQQGIIVVGDIDVDRIEGKIKEMFADIEMPENVKERVYLPVDDTEGTIYAIGHDKEQNSAMVQLMIKTETLPTQYNNTVMRFATDYTTDMITSMLNTRLDEISSKPDAPFAAAGSDYGNFFLAKTKDAFSLYVVGKNSDLPPALAAAYRELLRAARGGFTQTEYERARAEYLSRHEKEYNNRNQRENSAYVNQYVNNFLDNMPMPTADEKFETVKLIANSTPLDIINQTIASLLTDNNRVVLALLPDNDDNKYPTKEEFASALAAVDAETIEPYKEELKAEPLIPSLPAPGKIVSENKLTQWDATEWTLSNGAKVIVKPTKFKDDEILFTARANNGTSTIGNDYANSLIFMPIALQSYGLGTYSNSDLTKYLAGKQASLHPNFNAYTRTFSGNTTPKDLPTLMELIYMGFTGLNFTSEEFEALQNTYAGLLHNQESNPEYIFQTKIYEALYNAPRMKALSVEAIKGADRAQIVEIASEMTKNAAEYTFIFVGNVDVNTLRPLVEQYIATLPADAKAARKDIALSSELSIKTGKGTDTFLAKMETPQTWVYLQMFGDLPYTTKNSQLASVAAQILSKRMLDKVREEMGAVYSIGAQGSMDRISDHVSNTEIMSAFPMKPEMKAETLKVIEQMFSDMTKDVTAEELDKVKEFMVKTYTENREKNSPWMAAISGWVVNDVDSFNDNIESMNSITVDDVKAFVKSLAEQGNYRVVVLDPAE
ncbi:MAG: insulinase family protein [Paramuribaculum sp.]|nr:insulinase family protein [Paramuribaculum sp.]